MKRFRMPLILVGAAVIALVLVLLQPGGQKPYSKSADGTLVVLERTALGKASLPSQAQSGIQMYRELVANLMRRPTFRRNSDPDSLVFWISHRNSASGSYKDLDWFSHAKIVDEHGCEFTSRKHRVEADQWTASGTPLPKAPMGSKFIIGSGEFRTFPRRSAELTLRLYNHANQSLAELTFPNPVRETFPVWTPKALPIPRRIGDTTFTLVSITNRLMVVTENNTQLEKPVLVPNYQFSVNGIITNNWVAGETRLTDPTGNESSSSFYSLCGAEAAWNVRTYFHRTTDSRFASDELWRLSDIQFPDPGSATLLQRSNQIQGVGIEIRALGGAGRVIYSNGIPLKATAPTRQSGGVSFSISSRYSGGRSICDIDATSDTVQTIVEVTGLKPEQRLDLWASAPDGRRIFTQNAVSGNLILFIARGDPLPASVDLCVAVQNKVCVDFPIAPPAFPVSRNALSTDELERIREAIQTRDTSIDPRHIDLTPFFTATFAQNEWLQAQGPVPNGSVSRTYRRFGLPPGLQVLSGVAFDVRGAIQLGGLALKQAGHSFPQEVTGIPIKRSCQKILFLHGAIWTMEEGTRVGSYEIHYRDGVSESVSIVYGREVRDWALQRNESPQVPKASIAWTREDPLQATSDGVLYMMEWINPRPFAVIESIDFRSTMTSVAPFLVGITVE